MNRIISLSVEDMYIKYTGEAFGATGSHNAVTLRMTFGPAWEGTAKTAYFTDALGNASVALVLGLDTLVDGAYEVDVPSEALKTAGVATITIKGVLVSGETTTKAITTAAGHFRVLDSELPDSAGSAGAITPSDKDQLQAEIAGMEALFTTAKAAAETAAANAKVSETNAKTSETAAASSASSAESSKTAAAESAATATEQASAANESAAKAAASQKAAQTAETNAKASETAAAASQGSAETASASAQASAASAAQSAQTAQGAASTATNAASSASQSATAAFGSASQASAAATAAADSAAGAETANKTAQSWAVGGTGTRPGEDTDSAKYWAKQAEAVAGGDFATKTELAAKVSMVITEIPRGRMRGDIKGTGKVGTVADLTASQYYGTKIDPANPDSWACDIDGNGFVNSSDSDTMLTGKLYSTPLIADYYNNWTYHKVDRTSGYWTTELSILAITAEMGVSITCGGSVLAGTFIKAEPFAGGVRIYANYPPIEALPCEVSYSTGAGGQIITADTDISEAQKYVTTHNQSADAHADIRKVLNGKAAGTHASQHGSNGSDPITPTAIGAVGYDAAQSLSDAQKTQARGNIGAAPSGYGLGEYATQLPERDCNKATFNGWYINQGADEVNCPKNGNTIMSYGTLFVSAKSYTNVTQFYFPAISNFTGYCIRTFDGTTWTPWEWPDPPMALGVEYRTTERYMGKPVYCQLVDFGTLPNNSSKGLYISSVDAKAVTIRWAGLTSNLYALPGGNLVSSWAEIAVRIIGSRINVKTTTDESAYSAKFTLWYYKSTD